MIKNGKVVSLKYTLKNDGGQELDKADNNDPFVYLHGSNQIIKGLEESLEGLKVGDKKKVSVAAADGYGEIDPALKLEVNRTQFPENMELKAGMQFETATPDGGGMLFTIESVGADKVVVDGNHPLAGQNLHFDVEVLEVRDATEEELEHGHSHGSGCCH